MVVSLDYGKWEFHGRKVGETRLGTQTGINNNEKCKKFYITTEICGGSVDTGSDDNDDR